MPRRNLWIVLLLLLSLVLGGCANPPRDGQPGLNQESPVLEQPTQKPAEADNGKDVQPPESEGSSRTTPDDSTVEEMDAIQAEIDEMLRMLEETDSEIVIP